MKGIVIFLIGSTASVTYEIDSELLTKNRNMNHHFMLNVHNFFIHSYMNETQWTHLMIKYCRISSEVRTQMASIFFVA